MSGRFRFRRGNRLEGVSRLLRRLEKVVDEFTGSGKPLTEDGLAGALARLDASAPNLWAVLAVETAGCGYLPDRRPKILFERHVFHRLTNGRYDADDPDISASTPRGYGAGGANQYLRLQAALQLDRTAALMSASWGLGQIMGENFRAAGFDSVDSMVAAFVESEDGQLLSMINFVKSAKMDTTIRLKQWTTFARLYNGPDYAENDYDGKLKLFCAHYESLGCPDAAVRGCQVMLNYAGFDTGGIDGVAGRLTVAAVRAYQQKHGLQENGEADAGLLATMQA